MAMGRFLVDAGFELIAPSRPGYLGTPLAGRESFDSQAELLAAMLDALGHDGAAFLTWSGGGPSGYLLAASRPERVSKLVAFAAVSGNYKSPNEGIDDRLIMETRPGNWLLRELAARAPKTAIRATLGAEGDLTRKELKAQVAEVMADEEQADVVLSMANVVGDYEHRREGIVNDRARFTEIRNLGLERIAAPTLIVVGDTDVDVPPSHSDFAAETIPGAEKLTMKRGTHLSLFAHPDARAAQKRVVDFLRG
jgi:pimeloyl-ACP methyl ester carboxylesterase